MDLNFVDIEVGSSGYPTGQQADTVTAHRPAEHVTNVPKKHSLHGTGTPCTFALTALASIHLSSTESCRLVGLAATKNLFYSSYTRNNLSEEGLRGSSIHGLPPKQPSLQYRVHAHSNLNAGQINSPFLFDSALFDISANNRMKINDRRRRRRPRRRWAPRPPPALSEGRSSDGRPIFKCLACSCKCTLQACFTALLVLQSMFQMSRSLNVDILFLARISLLFLHNTNPHERIHEALHRSQDTLRRRPRQPLERSRRIRFFTPPPTRKTPVYN